MISCDCRPSRDGFLRAGPLSKFASCHDISCPFSSQNTTIAMQRQSLEQLGNEYIDIVPDWRGVSVELLLNRADIDPYAS